MIHPLFFRMTYLDPGSGSLLVQLLAAGLLGTVAILAKTFWGRITLLFKGKKTETTDSVENETDSQPDEK